MEDGAPKIVSPSPKRKGKEDRTKLKLHCNKAEDGLQNSACECKAKN